MKSHKLVFKNLLIGSFALAGCVSPNTTGLTPGASQVPPSSDPTSSTTGNPNQPTACVASFATLVAAPNIHLDYGPGSRSSGFSRAQKLLVNNGFVYWFDYDNTNQDFLGGSLRRVSSAGGTAQILVSGLGLVNDFAVDANNVYWVGYNMQTGEDSYVKKVALSNLAVTTLATGTPAGSSVLLHWVESIAIDSSYVYWGEENPSAGLRRVPIAGGNVQDIIHDGVGIKPLTITTDSTFVYVIDANSEKLRKVNIGSGLATDLTSGIYDDAFSLILSGANLFWTNLSGTAADGAFQMPVAGGAQSLITGHAPHNLAVDSQAIYYVGSIDPGAGESNVVRTSIADGSKTEYQVCTSIGGPKPAVVAVDSTSVYAFLAMGDGSQGFTTSLVKWAK